MSDHEWDSSSDEYEFSALNNAKKKAKESIENKTDEENANEVTDKTSNETANSIQPNAKSDGKKQQKGLPEKNEMDGIDQSIADQEGRANILFSGNTDNNIANIIDSFAIDEVEEEPYDGAFAWLNYSHMIALILPAANLIVTLTNLQDPCISKTTCEGHGILLPYPTAITAGVQFLTYIVIGIIAALNNDLLYATFTGMFFLLAVILASVIMVEYIYYCNCENSIPGKMLIADFVITLLIFIIVLTGVIGNYVHEYCVNRDPLSRSVQLSVVEGLNF